ncbi:MAG TPA: ATP-binding protein, partial [Flavobacteriaceae bacterium]|nr:ATP-binding protein [Flavobacteriaceae bacterium]
QYFFVRDSIHNTEIKEKIATLNIEYQTEKKENKILQQRADLAEKELKLKQKNILLYGSLGLALLLGLLGYLLFNQQKLKTTQLRKEGELRTALAKIETQNKLQEQRLRISRDLHDNIGAQLTFIISSIDNLKYGFSEISGRLGEKLAGISSFTTQTIYELRDTIWAMNKNTITFEDLQARISNFIEHAGHLSEKIEFSFQIDENMNENHSFTSVEGMNIFRIIQEAVNNAVKYSDATTISIDVSQTNENFLIEIKDNGKGFDFQHITPGNGLNNMKKRSRDIHSKISFVSEPNQGTSVLLEIPRNHKQPIPEES